MVHGATAANDGTWFAMSQQPDRMTNVAQHAGILEPIAALLESDR
jgi:hypothetical protein